MADVTDPYEQRALFAQRFSGTTNLDQRRRFSEDISEAKARHEERQQAEFEAAQQRNPELMRAVTGRMAERRQLDTELTRRDMAERKFQWDVEKASQLEQLSKQRLEIQIQSERRAIREEALKMERWNQEKSDTLAVEETEDALRQQFGPGTPEYRAGLLEAFLRHPNVKKDYRQFALKEAGIQDPDAAYEDAAIKLRDFPGSRATIPLAGGGKATIVGPKAEADIDSQIAKAQDRRAKAVKFADPEYLAFAESALTRLQGMKGEQAAPVQTAAAPTTAATNNFTDPESYKKAREAAASGTILFYNGKPYRKP